MQFNSAPEPRATCGNDYVILGIPRCRYIVAVKHPAMIKLQKSMIFNAKFIVINTNFIIINAKLMIFNTKFMILTCKRSLSPCSS